MRFLFAQTHAPASHHSSFCPQGCDYTNNNVNWYYDEATREIKIGDKCLDSDDELTGALQNDDAKVVVNGENWAKKPVSTQNNDDSFYQTHSSHSPFTHQTAMAGYFNNGITSPI